MFPLREAILFGIAVLDVAFAAAVVWRNPKKIAYWAFAAIPLGAAIWAVGLAMLSITSGGLIWGKIIFGSSLLVFPSLVVFSDVFPTKTKFERRHLLPFLPGVALLLALPTDLILRSHLIRGTQIIKVTGPLYPSYNIFILVCLAWTTLNLLVKYRKAAPVTKLQLYYLLFGFFVFVLFGLTTNLILPLLGESELIMSGPAASLFFITFATYAIARYRLVDIRDAVRKGIVVLILVTAAPPLLFAFYQILIQAFPSHLPMLLPSAIGLTLLVIGLAGAMFVPFVQRYTEQLFFRGSYIYSDILAKLTKVFTEARSVESLSRDIVEILTASLKVNKAVFFLRTSGGKRFLPASTSGVHDPRVVTLDSAGGLVSYARRRAGAILMAEEIEEDKSTSVAKAALNEFKKCKIRLCIVVRRRGRLEGLICLGEKSSGAPYTMRDIRLFQMIADLTGVALENVRLYAFMKKSEKENSGLVI